MISRTSFLVVLAAFAALTVADSGVSWGQDYTLFTDADATVRIICRNDQSEAACNTPLGQDEPGYIRVHNDNNMETGYFHFDLSDIDAGSQVTEARLQLDAQTNSWGDTTVSVFAIMDPEKDWDLNALPEDEIIGSIAPQSDWESYAWTGDTANQQRFNYPPAPFLDEGGAANAIVRELEVQTVIEDQDPLTTEDGNSYGGYAGADGPGTAGAADGGDNIWPTKNALDVDITPLVKWKLGQNASYSTFQPGDRELTILVRTDESLTNGNGFVRFISKESNFLGGELDLAPARIVLSGNIIETPAGPPLQAGDADQDLDFDQLDLVKVQVAAKYLTGQAATWGEGDWNGAPGGQRGSPPQGNGLFDQLDIVAALNAGKYLAGPYAALAGPGTQGDGQTSLVYNAGTGELSVDPAAGKGLTSVNIDSAGSRFIGSKPGVLDGSFDNFGPGNIFKATFGSQFGAISFGNALPAGLSEDVVRADLTAVGSLAGGGALGTVDLVYIPEPAAILLAVAGLVCLAAAARRCPRPR